MESSRTVDGPHSAPQPLTGAPIAVGEMVAGRSVVSQIRRGGQAWVLIADDHEGGTRRAIKVPLQDGVVADDAELAMLLGIEPHPHVVNVLGVTKIKGRRGIVLEYVPSTLSELLRRCGNEQGMADQPPLPGAVGLVLQQVCSGLAHLSAETELAHLDLKPSNVLISDDGQAKVADFGLAQQVRVNNGRFPAARGGTWAYAAPEVLRQEPCDARSDIFSFGILLYEACTGQLPYPFPLEKGSGAQRRQLLDYYASSDSRRRPQELYYWAQGPTQFPVALPERNISVLLSCCLMEGQVDRLPSFIKLAPLLAKALCLPPLPTAPALLPDNDRRRRELTLSQVLTRLGQFDEATIRLNRLLAESLSNDLFAEVREAAIDALTQGGRHDDAAALADWR